MSDSIDALTSELMTVKENITELNAAVRDLTSQKHDLELRVIAGIQALGLDQVRNTIGTFTLTESIVSSEIDWEVFHKYIIDTNQLTLLHRRVSEKEYSDLIKMGEDIPGTTPFRKTNLRTLTRKL